MGFSASYVNVNKDEKLNTDKKAFSLAYTNHRATTNECYEFVTTYPNDTTYQANLFQEGKMSISKLDNVNRIISGTFSCSIIHAGCDTLKITEGRFDFKF